MTTRVLVWAAVFIAGCGTGEPAVDGGLEGARQRIFEAHDAMVSAMVEGRSTAPYLTSEWQGVNLNGTPMNREGFEGEERAMEYDDVEVLDRELRVYGEAAALRWHANFFVKVNGQPSFAEMRLLDVYVLRDGQWLNDLTQATPVFGTVGNPPER
ncbi:MAG TPA: nuclear transport factor 2 family protein [Thermoanaerobaculia bacterium]|nr:nuclear transport factor 2 family protein [Thermoanaerobaculia bacterium]